MRMRDWLDSAYQTMLSSASMRTEVSTNLPQGAGNDSLNNRTAFFVQQMYFVDDEKFQALKDELNSASSVGTLAIPKQVRLHLLVSA